MYYRQFLSIQRLVSGILDHWHCSIQMQKMECFVSSVDSALYTIMLPLDATGYECLIKICRLLGTVEHDYFGLKYSDCDGLFAWINNRLMLRTQIKSSPPYLLYLRVKYFVDPSTLQQPTTKHLFFLETKVLLREGRLSVNEQHAGEIGALLAQAEMGNIVENRPREHSIPGYPQYFKEWEVETPGIIALEHSRLEGMSRTHAEGKVLECAAKLTNWGVSYEKVIHKENNSTAYIGIGGLQLTLLDLDLRTVKRIPYDILHATSYSKKLFYIRYVAHDYEGGTVLMDFVVECAHCRIALYLYRAVTEDYFFFTQQTVSDTVLNHVRHQPGREFFLTHFGISFERHYYFDVLKTRTEVYAHVWETLHQVNQALMTTAAMQSNRQSRILDNEPYPTSKSPQHTAPANNEDRLCNTEVSSSITAKLAKIGLSKSSLDIAQELLELICDGSGEKNDDPRGACEAKPEGQLRLVTAAKLEQLLSNIHESRLCCVCMTEPASAVFCPCGHLVACYTCALACKKCALCRQDVGYVQYVYISGL